MIATSLREAAMYVWESFLNTPYRWGGNDPLDGVDCSGLVIEGLKAVGMTPREADYTAHQLAHQVFAHRPRLEPLTARRGRLVFWGNPVRHVEIVWSVHQVGTERRILTIGASGGGSKTVDRAAAVRQNAYVKIRRMTPNPSVILDPFDD